MDKKVTVDPNAGSLRFGVISAFFMILVLTGVSFGLLFQLGGSDDEMMRNYMTAQYKVPSQSELEQKLKALGQHRARGMATLKNLDMPDLGKVQSTMQKVDLFDHVFSREELCLTQAVYFEARGEPLIGQVAIAEVVLNRVVNRRYPNDACGVIFQNQHLPNRCQFSFACDGKSDRPTDPRAWERALKIVALVMAGERSGVAKKATHYHASYVSPYWRLHFDKVGEVGRHIFYRDGVI